jgi:flagellar basal-body rod protein FlgF
MDNAIYTILGRQSGLLREMQVTANNIANASTTGFRREGVVFAEHVRNLAAEPSLSLAHASARVLDFSEAAPEPTGGAFDLAIRGPGFFRVRTPTGEMLTRAGHFMPNAEGTLVTAEGHPLLDDGGAPIVVPPGMGPPGVAPDGTLSADGLPFGRVGLWRPTDPLSLRHVAGTLFSADGSEPADEGTTVLQGYLEGSNVNPVSEIARMIAVSRAYEAGQSLADREDERIRAVIQTLGR